MEVTRVLIETSQKLRGSKGASKGATEDQQGPTEYVWDIIQGGMGEEINTLTEEAMAEWENQIKLDAEVNGIRAEKVAGGEAGKEVTYRVYAGSVTYAVWSLRVVKLRLSAKWGKG